MDVALAEKLVGAWRRVYLLLKPLEDKVDAARAKVVKLLVDAGVDQLETKFGKLTLQRKSTINWEALARKFVSEDIINAELKTFTSTSSPFVRAPQKWAGEAKP